MREQINLFCTLQANRIHRCAASDTVTVDNKVFVDRRGEIRHRKLVSVSEKRGTHTQIMGIFFSLFLSQVLCVQNLCFRFQAYLASFLRQISSQ